MIDAVTRERSFGMPAWLGVSTVDYQQCSQLLQDAEFIGAPFDQWPSIAEAQEQEAVAAYIRTIVDDHRFHSFLLGVTGIETRARIAEARLATVEANLQTLLGSTSWRMTEPLRRLARALGWARRRRGG